MPFKVLLSSDLENRFRRAAFQQKGFKKGALKLAIQEAIEEWLLKHS